MSAPSYKKAVNSLIDKGYLIRTATNSSYFEFWEIPKPELAEQREFEYQEKKEMKKWVERAGTAQTVKGFDF